MLQEIFDKVIENALKVLKIAAHERKFTHKELKDLEKDLLKDYLSNYAADAANSDIAKFILKIQTYIEYAMTAIDLLKDIRLAAISQTVAKDTAVILEITLGKNALEIPTPQYFKSVASKILIQGAPQKDWWQAQTDDLKLKFGAQVRQGLLNGETNQQIITRIVGTDTSPGVMTVARRNAATLVQTAVQSVANEARRETFKLNSNFILGLMQVSTLDSHTSDICIAYSGEQWDLEGNPINGSTLPFNGGTPRHWNCRSVEIPITKTFKQLGIDQAEVADGTRSSEEGPISVNTSFDSFLKRKTVAQQDAMLGHGRAQLWRDGKITLKDLVNGEGQPLDIHAIETKVSDNDIKELFARISEPDGGFTYQPDNFTQPAKGFAVSPFPENSFAIDFKDFTAKDLINYISDHKKLFKNKDTYLGAWHDPETDKIFLDISVVKELEDEAKKLALKYDQIAYFDLAQGKSIDVNRAATSGGVT